MKKMTVSEAKAKVQPGWWLRYSERWHLIHRIPGQKGYEVGFMGSPDGDDKFDNATNWTVIAAVREHADAEPYEIVADPEPATWTPRIGMVVRCVKDRDTAKEGDELEVSGWQCRSDRWKMTGMSLLTTDEMRLHFEPV